MKKLFSVMLTVVMLVTCIFSTFTTVNAANVDIGIESVKDVISFIDVNMPDSALKRIEVYNILSTFAKNDMGLDTLLGVLDGSISPDSDEGIKKIVDELAANGASLFDYKDELTFVINLIKGLKDSDVEKAIEAFEKIREEAEANGGKEEKIVSHQKDLNSMYEFYVSADGREKLASHNVGPNAILRLLKTFEGYVMLTDDEVGGEDFALSWVDDSYDDSVFDYIDSINGEEVGSVEDIFTVIINSVNDDAEYTAEINQKIKNVFGEIGIYEPLEDEDDDEGEGGGIYDPIKRPGSSGEIGGIVFPKGTEAPKEDSEYDEVDKGNIVAPPAEGTTVMPDTTEHWAKDYISYMLENKLFVGYDTGNFEPDWGITRQEMAVVLVRLLGIEDQLGSAAAPTYNDVDEVAPWAADYVALTTKLGIYEGYDDGYFRPEKIVTREELCAIIIRSMENSGNKVVLNYLDRDSFPEWSTGYIGKATYFGIVQGYPDKTFKPTRDVTRAEAAKMLYNYIQIR